jgi:hypothetical protein
MRCFKGLTALAVVATSVGCGDVSRDGRSPMYLVINKLEAVRGGKSAGTPQGTLFADVITNVTSPEPCSTKSPCPTVFADSGVVEFKVSPRDIGNTASPAAPTTNNQVTIYRYRVTYRRADGRNRPGVDLPYGFEGAITGTIPASGTLGMTFELVRHIAKEESPLVELQRSQTIISAIADIQFWGRDQVGNDITATGSMLVEFGDFGD